MVCELGTVLPCDRFCLILGPKRLLDIRETAPSIVIRGEWL